MRVLLVDPSSRGGIAAYTVQLAAALASVGEDPVVLASTGLAPGRVDDVAQVLRRLPDHVWGKPPGAGARFYVRRAKELATSTAALLRTVREVRPDVVHVQFGLNPRADAALVRAVQRTAPVVWTAHDVEALDGSPGARQLDALRAADRVVVHSEPAQEHLATRGLHSEVVEHVRAHLPPEAICTRGEARARLGLPPEGRLLAALGFVRPYKGYGLLADVWEALGDAAPHLVVLGAAWSAEDRAVLDRLEGTGRCDVRRGYASELDLALAARAADAVLLPHVRASDSGLLHLARATGTPVLASDAPQLAASVTRTQAGRVLPRRPEVWQQAVSGPLPSPPDPPATLQETGRRHQELYERAAQRRRGRRPRVVALTDATEVGGAEKVLAQVVAGIAERYAVTVVANSPEVLRLVRSSSPVDGVLLPPVADKRDLRPIAAHVRALRGLRPDLVVVNLRTPWAAQYGTVAALAAGAAVVAVEHAPVPATARFQVLAKRVLAGRLRGHVAVTADAARSVEQLAGLPAGRVGVVPNGLLRRAPAPAPLPAGLVRPLVVAAGRLDSLKGFDVLLHAMAELPQASLWLLGEGEQREALTALADELRIAHRVRFEGWHPDPPRAFAAADVVVISSRRDALPLTAFEALQAGAPLVATRVGALPEAVGTAAVLVEPDDPRALAAAVRDLLADPARARALGDEGRRLAASAPTIEEMVEGYVAVLERALKARRRH